MTTTTKQKNILVRTWDRLTKIAVAMDYDSAQYTYDQMAWLQTELIAVKARVEQLETERNKVTFECTEDAA